MNRFDHSNPTFGRRFALWVPVISFLVILFLFLYGIDSVSTTTDSKQLESLQSALNRSISQCYAVEGIYPPDLQYLKDHYGLTYDADVYYIDYEIFGSNLMPEVTVIKKQSK